MHGFFNSAGLVIRRAADVVGGRWGVLHGAQ
jgi:hypothetical protein